MISRGEGQSLLSFFTSFTIVLDATMPALLDRFPSDDGKKRETPNYITNRINILLHQERDEKGAKALAQEWGIAWLN